MCPRRGNDPASGHPRAHQPPLGRGTSPPAWDGRLDAPGQRRRHLPSSAWTRRREVKQGKSGGSVGTTDQGKGKGRSVVRPMGTVAYRGKGQGKGKGRGEGRLGQGGRGRSKGGEKLMGTTAYGGKGSKGRAANGDRPVGAASCRRDHHTMASCQNPHAATCPSQNRNRKNQIISSAPLFCLRRLVRFFLLKIFENFCEQHVPHLRSTGHIAVTVPKSHIRKCPTLPPSPQLLQETPLDKADAMLAGLLETSCFSNLPLIDCHYDPDYRALGESLCRRLHSHWVYWWAHNVYFWQCLLRLLNRWQLLWCVLCCVSVVVCKRFGIVATIPTGLWVNVLLFPLAFSVNAAYQRREGALSQSAEFKASCLTLYLSHRCWLFHETVPHDFLHCSCACFGALFDEVRGYLIAKSEAQKVWRTGPLFSTRGSGAVACRPLRSPSVPSPGPAQSPPPLPRVPFTNLAPLEGAAGGGGDWTPPPRPPRAS